MRYELFTDYGQFEINDVRLHEGRDDSPLPGFIVDSSTFEYGIALVVFREWGTITVDVDVLEAEPTPLGQGVAGRPRILGGCGGGCVDRRLGR